MAVACARGGHRKVGVSEPFGGTPPLCQASPTSAKAVIVWSVFERRDEAVLTDTKSQEGAHEDLQPPDSIKGKQTINGSSTKNYNFFVSPFWWVCCCQILRNDAALRFCWSAMSSSLNPSFRNFLSLRCFLVGTIFASSLEPPRFA